MRRHAALPEGSTISGETPETKGGGISNKKGEAELAFHFLLEKIMSAFHDELAGTMRRGDSLFE
jgi:hypothetical protein